MASSEGSTGEGPASKLTHVVVGRTQILVGCRNESPPSSWSQEPLHGTLHNVVAGLQQSKSASKGDSEQGGDQSLFGHQISKVTFHHFCHILFIGSESRVQITLKGRGLHKGVNTRRQESSRGIPEAACPTFALAETWSDPELIR